MNGTVHGVATTTASTPVKKAPVTPLFAVRPWPMPAKPPPISNTPARFSPTTKKT